MPKTPPATSLLEFLTHPNPTVSHLTPRSKTNTRHGKWYRPKQVKKWEGFHDFDVLKSSFRGRLIQAAIQGGRELPSYPYVHPQVDLTIREEEDTKSLFDKWNKSIVTAALDSIHGEFRPAMWSKGDLSPGNEESTPPSTPEKKRKQPPRESSAPAKRPKRQSARGLRHDSGSTAWDSRPAGADSDGTSCRRERFPKEYKPSGKWKSELVFESELINEAGEWERGQTTANLAWPIRQAFTYCIQSLCRYGCILTCHEAFIFRIKPLGNEPANGPHDPELLRKRLMANGMMEYISIPWESHRRADVESHDSWTINLALWFVHILAGNNYEAAWEYGPLKDEDLVASGTTDELTCQADDEPTEGDEGLSDSGESDRTLPFDKSLFTSLKKRKRNSDVEADQGFNLSFTKRQFVEA
ncbi:hypothetical protein QQX98_004140 [Neonectria punicea]|uniref:Fungal-type protein kinase domain-containing protein n=1 Tax=Neonectria punicea TaxID=979145 RepID=A0ABR1HAK1_9HYPO